MRNKVIPQVLIIFILATSTFSKVSAQKKNFERDLPQVVSTHTDDEYDLPIFNITFLMKRKKRAIWYKFDDNANTIVDRYEAKIAFAYDDDPSSVGGKNWVRLDEDNFVKTNHSLQKRRYGGIFKRKEIIQLIINIPVEALTSNLDVIYCSKNGASKWDPDECFKTGGSKGHDGTIHFPSDGPD
ncbi:MAG: hypothetical protein ABJP45_02615 [Cyclobacteriaceae bacterium]